MSALPNFIVMLHHHIRKDERQRIEIRVHYNRVSKYHKTELFLHAQHFNPSGIQKVKKGKKEVFIEDYWIKSSYHKYKEFNQIIAEGVNRLNQAWKQLQKEKKIITAESILAKVQEPEKAGDSIITFINLAIKEKRLAKQFKLADVYIQAFKKLFLFANSDIKYDKSLNEFSRGEFYWEELTNEKLRAFKIFMLTTKTRRGTTMKISSASFYLVVIQGVLDKHPDYSDFITKQFKGIALDFDREKANKLSVEQINDLWKLDLSNNKRLYDALQAFLFCYFCQGIRIGEAITLQVKDYQNNRVLVKIEKSGKKQRFRDILLSEKASLIIENYVSNKAPDEYIFPFLNNTNDFKPEALRQKMDIAIYAINTSLKTIAKNLNWEFEFTTHSARGSFIKESTNKGDIYLTSQGVGHAKVQTTEGYSEIKKIRVDSLNDVYQD